MRYRLRTLLIVFAVAPALLAPLCMWARQRYLEWSLPREEMRITRELYLQFYGPHVKPPTEPLPLGPKD